MERAAKVKTESDSNKLFRLVLENQGLNAQELSSRLGWNRTKTNRLLGTLERKGWIVRRVFPAAQPRIAVEPDEAVKRLTGQFERLAAWKTRLQKREKELFEKCVSAQMEGDQEKATMYANQCAEVRKIIALVAKTELTLSRLSAPVT
jgi:division protein CdvB (Snf7/Vps24/ESCRT-III family)